jgi:hypothetical protein
VFSSTTTPTNEYAFPVRLAGTTGPDPAPSPEGATVAAAPFTPAFEPDAFPEPELVLAAALAVLEVPLPQPVFEKNNRMPPKKANATDLFSRGLCLSNTHLLGNNTEGLFPAASAWKDEMLEYSGLLYSPFERKPGLEEASTCCHRLPFIAHPATSPGNSPLHESIKLPGAIA